ncbi:MAG: murein biosynthesis integral membrane protein MurJ [Spirochaetales bacterium]|nr:murein biosynthesis integral membrane protein MurJ [Spirochaetales bacterium]
MVMVCTMLSRVLGFVRIAVIGAIFGASGTADVWNAVFTIPNNLRKLMAEGALSSAFIPGLSASLVEDPSGEEARGLTRRIITLQLVILVPLVLGSILLARPIMHALLSFPEPQKMELSVDLFRWVFPYLILISVSAVIMGVLNSHNVFVLPALTPILFSICVIAATLLLYRRLGIFSMVVGVLVGGLAQVLFQLPAYLRRGYDLRLSFGFRQRVFLKVLRAWGPVLASASIFALTEQVAVLFASGLRDGSTSALSYALVFFQLPFGIFSISIVTVLFPRMSRQAARGDRGGLVDSVSYGLRFIMVLLVPAALLYLVMGREIIGLAMERYNFTSGDTVRTARVLSAYSIGLFSLGGFTFLQRFFYSSGDFRTPLVGALIVSALDIGFSLWLKETRLQVSGLAVANSIAFTAGLLFLTWRARRALGSLNGRMLARTASRVAVSMVPFVLFLWGYLRLTPGWWAPASSVRSLVGVALGLAVGAGIVLGMYWLLRVEMLRDVLKRWKD